ncbi:hypothetical protein ACFY7C_19310 [Streptomyces sp. NPDC012769]|uniref:hypothetical protein n=1 Tax=Streptomyces sp. NPDC012769 TaxID=3364848 RepID=UPI0036B05215
MTDPDTVALGAAAADTGATTLHLLKEPSEEFVEWVRDNSSIKAIIWPGGALALP